MPSASPNEVTKAWAYDTAGRPSSHTVSTPAPNAASHVFTHGWDAAGNLTIYPQNTLGIHQGTLTATYAYDALSQMTGVTTSGLQVASATIAYDTLSRRTLLTFGDSSTQAYEYEADDDLASMAHAFTTSPSLNNVTYSWTNDKLGRQVSRQSPARELAMPVAKDSIRCRVDSAQWSNAYLNRDARDRVGRGVMILMSDRMAKDHRYARAGYTLTEMLVVVAIIGLISAVVIPQTIGQLGKAQSRAAKLQAQTVAAAVELFSGDNGRFPTQEEGLMALVKQPEGLDSWTGPYLRTEDQLKDPWGRPFLYTAEEGTFSVTTLGADNKAGGNGADRDIALRQ